MNVAQGGLGWAKAGSGGIARAGLQVFWESLFLGEGSFRPSRGIRMTAGQS